MQRYFPRQHLPSATPLPLTPSHPQRQVHPTYPHRLPHSPTFFPTSQHADLQASKRHTIPSPSPTHSRYPLNPSSATQSPGSPTATHRNSHVSRAIPSQAVRSRNGTTFRYRPHLEAKTHQIEHLLPVVAVATLSEGFQSPPPNHVAQPPAPIGLQGWYQHMQCTCLDLQGLAYRTTTPHPASIPPTT